MLGTMACNLLRFSRILVYGGGMDADRRFFGVHLENDGGHRVIRGELLPLIAPVRLEKLIKKNVFGKFLELPFHDFQKLPVSGARLLLALGVGLRQGLFVNSSETSARFVRFGIIGLKLAQYATF